jgi:hypothetical protein
MRAPMNRRDGLKLGTASLMTSLLPIPASVAAQTESPPKEKAIADNAAIRPFHFEASQADLADLRRRVSATKWPEWEQVSDATQGVQLATIQKLAQHWAMQHDWLKCEAKINAVPNFITEIDGFDIHFIHVRSKHENALPMIVTHGWPGSFIEQMKIIEPLTNPTAHGGTAVDALPPRDSSLRVPILRRGNRRSFLPPRCAHRSNRFAADSNEKASSRNVNGLEHDYQSSLQSKRL